VRFPDGSWGVVDSNVPPNGQEPPALTLLQKNGAERLAFVCLTHPHADHYSGLARILQSYEGRVDEFWMFSVDTSHVRQFLNYQHRTNATTGRGQRRYAELQTVFEIFWKMDKAGFAHRLVGGLRLPPLGGVDIDCLAPLSKDINEYQAQLVRHADSGGYLVDENLLSAVLRLRFVGSTILLSSDAPTKAWPMMWKESKKRGESFAADAVKVSHHGSRQGHHEGIWRKILSDRPTHAAISAGVGHGHPEYAVLKSLFDLGVRLHCTNFPEHCSKSKPTDMSKFDGLPSGVRMRLFMLDQSENPPLSPCNGDIRFDLNPDGTCNVAHQFEGFCPMHL